MSKCRYCHHIAFTHDDGCIARPSGESAPAERHPKFIQIVRETGTINALDADGVVWQFAHGFTAEESHWFPLSMRRGNPKQKRVDVTA